MRFEERVDIAAPAEQVWSVMSDVVRWPEWTPSVSSVEPLGDRPLAVGARYRLRQPRLPAAVWEVTEVVPGVSFTWTNRSAGLTSTGVHSISGSSVTLVLEQTGPLVLLTLPFRSLTRRYVALEAAGLKQRCER